ncbi:myotubularin-related protein 3 isoform X1 [Suricata suricatta]|uniref:phosphatidylinositol-3,5-bisphosphate 3-phosphatase n=1 Tax=Suricata suricatta TaxID=37032 RepID=A0A673TLM5_SURSU|nr:myotubularin-related protein 3 isoform X1 [Suricata suricatta]XP_029778880.1 myotubularin-related protein 3 isoform X1 [Suricata suricatta]XP_029778881.1 myotubularin-related protein 3 isoform X1 [Suricata suricatta]XP_029778882.1 myotubularin-related protein 3 isoform X1 [Suricata suricatta]XP_029778883.1 myotubularin-related protein 3 isoform X1 [Suricata suricatta]XP_029778884.1 myotubularin-related protein 3 isoform X1 [Suricata suricatta]
MDEETRHSLECIQANQIFPRKQLIREDENLQVPFLELHGESTEYVGRAEDAIIALSNYRLHIKFKESLVNVPLQLIESVECRDIFQLHLTCKDCKVIRCQFSTFEQCQEWLKRLNNAIRPPAKIEDLFSFAYHAWCMEVYASEKEQHGDLCRPGEHVTSRFKNEVERMGFDMNNAWRISNINEKYKLCGSYPQELIVPAWITDKELESVASFRSWKRIPAVVYRHQSNGAVIARCGQPEVSWWGWRNADDEHLVQSVAKACASDSRSSGSKLSTRNSSRDFPNAGDLSDVDFDSSLSNASGAESLAIQPQKLLILDARSYAAAVANRAKGGGCECPEYYPNCEVVFMGMANIHSIRRSFQSLRLLCTQMPDPGNWLSALESTKWLHHLSVLLKSALLVVHAVDRDQRPVLAHCSDGWDRTPQIVALAKLLLDPYYRTIEGFQVLVEMEWLDFGHKFADRCGHGENSDDLNERCPVFLQWLDCVHQLQRQFPCSFEFNEAFLVKLVQHTYSCLFGTFLCNNAKERGEKHTQERTCSVWSLLRAGNKAFKNLLYSSQSEAVLYPVCHVRNLMLWSAVYLPCPSPSTPVDDSCAPYPAPGTSPDDPPLSRLPKTRSFDNLTTACDNTVPLASRRSSDPSLNEKWQEHRRSLELSSLAGPGEEPLDPDNLGKSNKVLGGAELSVAAGVAEGQMENILQEATKEESGIEEPAHRGSIERQQVKEEALLEKEIRGKTPEGSAIILPQESELGDAALRNHPGTSLSLFSQGISEQQGGLSILPSSLQESPREEGTQEVPVEQPPIGAITEDREEAFLPIPVDLKVGYGTSQSSSLLPSQVPFEARGPNADSSMDMLMEGQVKSESGPEGHHRPCLVNSGWFSGKDIPPQATEPWPSERSIAESPQVGSVVHRTSPGSTHSPTRSPCALPLAECKEGRVCNGALETENKALEQSPGLSTLQKHPTPNGHCTNGEAGRSKDSLSRQLSATSCSSAHLHSRNLHHKWLHSHPGRPSTTGSPDQPSRSHLDDDGMPVYTDTIQQRLRQIESGHQQEVETLKKQVQELRSRLESQYLTSSLRFNGDFGDEVTSIPDSESNLDQNCLSRCSTEIFSEASWEQVDKQDTEMTRWLPDHLAAHCYACDSAFWLASRKHHCRDTDRVDQTWNCGNVFCSSCCNQKVPVPSQQLFEPSRVCKSCYSSLHPIPSSSIDLELDKPIAATSN